MSPITIHGTREPATGRPYGSDADFWRVRALLLETYPITPPDFNWEVRRWDGSRFHNAGAAWDPYWEGRVRLYPRATWSPPTISTTRWAFPRSTGAMSGARCGKRSAVNE